MGCSGSKNATEAAKSKTLLTQPDTQKLEEKQVVNRGKQQDGQTEGDTVTKPETQIVVRPEAEDPKASPIEPVHGETLIKLEDTAKEDLIELLNNAFDQMDLKGDGFVSKGELAVSLDFILEGSHVKSRKSIRMLLAESGLNPYLNAWGQLDTNYDGKISRDEFQANMHPSKAAKNVEQMLKEVFESIDTNEDGSLDKAEVSRAFADLLTKSCVQSQKNIKTLIVDAGLNPDLTFDELDANKDGKVTWEEFRAKLQPAFDASAFLKSIFKQLDANGDGAVSREELAVSIERILDCSDMKSKKSFRSLLQEAGLNTEFYLFEQLDTDGNGNITWDELEVLLKPVAVAVDSAVAELDREGFLKEVFKKCDHDLNGFLSLAEYQQLSKEKSSQAQAVMSMVFEMIDESGVKDGKLSLDEFVKFNLETGKSLSEDAFKKQASMWLELAAGRGETSFSDAALTKGTPVLEAMEQTDLVEAESVKVVCGWGGWW